MRLTVISTHGGDADRGDDGSQTIVVGTAADIVGLDITKVSVNTNFMLPNIYDTLTRRQHDGSNGPHMATSYEVSDDGSTWTSSFAMMSRSTTAIT